MGYAQRSRTSSSTHARKRNWNLINKYGNKHYRVTRKQGSGHDWSLVFVLKLISTFIGQNKEFFFMHVLKKDVLFLCA
jgi:hypothetical protein